MIERGILFSGSMVRALRDDRKTQTRRTRGLDKINADPDRWALINDCFEPGPDGTFKFWDRKVIQEDFYIRCPYGVPGDRLWTRETWRGLYAYNSAPPRDIPAGEPIWYEAEGKCPWLAAGKLRPGIFLPRWASRDMLEVISARPERLQDITEADAIAEGIHRFRLPLGDVFGCDPKGTPGKLVADDAISAYRLLWDSINGKTLPWKRNPWVWMVSFKRV